MKLVSAWIMPKITSAGFKEKCSLPGSLYDGILYYKERMENEELLVKHAIIGITDDHQKGALGVKMFEKEAITNIEREKGKNLRTVHKFTDGCASQYKGEISFFDISKQKELDVTCNVLKQAMASLFVIG